MFRLHLSNCWDGYGPGALEDSEQAGCDARDAIWRRSLKCYALLAVLPLNYFEIRILKFLQGSVWYLLATSERVYAPLLNGKIYKRWEDYKYSIEENYSDFCVLRSDVTPLKP